MIKMDKTLRIQMEQQFNQKNFRNASQTMVAASLPLFLAALFIEKIEISSITYAICVIGSIISEVFYKKITHHKALLYIGSTIYFMAAIISGVIYRYSNVSLQFVITLVLFSFWITDNPKIVISYLTTVFAFFVGITFTNGSGNMQGIDILGALCGLICSSVLSSVTYKSRMELFNEQSELSKKNAELKAQSDLFAKKMEEFKCLASKNYELAHYDPLTGLSNYRKMLSTVEGMFGVEVTLGTCDIDWFKDVNDTYGHPEGDRVLISLANAFNTLGILGINAFRVGGEEFYFISDDILPREMSSIIHRTVRKRNIAHPTSKYGKLTVSMGIIRGVISNVEDFYEMMKEVDRLMYQAKKEGRNCTSFSE